MQTLLPKRLKDDSCDKMKPSSVERLLEEWENMSGKEVLLQFYYSSVKEKLYIQGMYIAMLFFILLFIRDG